MNDDLNFHEKSTEVMSDSPIKQKNQGKAPLPSSTPASYEDSRGAAYSPYLFEKILVAVLSVGVFVLIGILTLKNEPVDPSLAGYLKTVLSFAVAALGATIPGFLRLDWRGKGLAVRAGGAMALFVLTFLWIPNPSARNFHFRITVLGPDGKPTNQAELSAPIGEINKTASGWELVVSASQKPADGVMTVYAAHPREAQSGSSVLNFAEGARQFKTIQLLRAADGKIVGRVTAPDGQAVIGARVSVLGYEPEAVLSGEAGHFELEGHAPIGEEVQVYASSGALTWRGFLMVGEPVEIRLKER